MQDDKNSTPEPQPAKRGRGRPKKDTPLTPAERAAAYRARKKASGMRETRAWIRDVRGDMPLESDIIDLSQCRDAKRTTG